MGIDLKPQTKKNRDLDPQNVMGCIQKVQHKNM